MILQLLSIGDWWGAYLEASRIKNEFFMAKALALKGDTTRAIMILGSSKSCREKRYRLALMVSKFMVESSRYTLNDSCFNKRDRILTEAHFLNFPYEDPLSDSLKSSLPRILEPSIGLMLNVVPGLGLVYAGKPFIGLKTFLANVLGIWGIWSSVKKGYYADAFLWYFFWENRFYFGSFSNTLKYIWQENQKRLDPYFERIIKMLEEG